jgi:hypothetical protein
MVNCAFGPSTPDFEEPRNVIAASNQPYKAVRRDWQAIRRSVMPQLNVFSKLSAALE